MSVPPVPLVIREVHEDQGDVTRSYSLSLFLETFDPEPRRLCKGNGNRSPIILDATRPNGDACVNFSDSEGFMRNIFKSGLSALAIITAMAMIAVVAVGTELVWGEFWVFDNASFNA